MADSSLRNITISLTLACNQGCAHCWVSAGPKQTERLSPEQIRSAIQQARALGAEHVKFTGGEPLMSRDIVSFVRDAAENDMRSSIETNGMLLRGRLLEELCSFDSPPHFYVSLDGASPVTHDAVRKHLGAFALTVRNLRAARDLGAYFSIHTVVRRENLAELPGLHDLVRELGASQHKLILDIHRLGRGSSAKEELGATLRDVLDVLHTMPEPEFWDYGWNPDRSRETRLMTTLPPALQPDPRGVTTCGWGDSYLGILADGSVALCHGLYGSEQGILGNIGEESLDAVWGRLQELGRSTMVNLNGICGNCVVKETCRGLCRASAVGAYGDVHAPYPMCQELYDDGLFPERMVIDPGRDASYPVLV